MANKSDDFRGVYQGREKYGVFILQRPRETQNDKKLKRWRGQKILVLGCLNWGRNIFYAT